MVGVGGLGTHVVQQFALLGVGRLVLVDKGELKKSSRNRYIGARHDDPVPGSPKVFIADRLAREINPLIDVETINDQLVSQSAFEAIRGCDYVFGCLDNDAARLVLNELCIAYSKPYFDLASDIPAGGTQYGGRVCAVWHDSGCLVCYGEIDAAEVDLNLMTEEQRRDHEAIYGVPADALDEVGPSVVSINGVGRLAGSDRVHACGYGEERPAQEVPEILWTLGGRDQRHRHPGPRLLLLRWRPRQGRLSGPHPIFEQAWPQPGRWQSCSLAIYSAFGFTLGGQV